jgi:prepilin-type N-terminal cleavage/methylation domain-containing protein
MKRRSPQLRGHQTRHGVTLIEIVAAITLSAVVAIASVRMFNQPRVVTGQTTCQLERATVEQEVQRYFHDFGVYPGRNMQELITSGYWNRIGAAGPGASASPTCSASGQTLQLQNGRVVCPIHGGD